MIVSQSKVNKLSIAILVLCMALAKSQKIFKTSAKLHWTSNDMVLRIESESPLPPKFVKVLPRPAEWFANDRCDLKQLTLNDTDLLKVTNLRFGFTGTKNQHHREMVNNIVYALTNFNRKNVYFFEIPTNYTMNMEEDVETPVYCWVYRHKFVGRMANKDEILECLDRFKLSSYAANQVGLDVHGRPIRNAHVYASMSSYFQWLDDLEAGNREIENNSPIRTTTPNYYNVDGPETVTEIPKTTKTQNDIVVDANKPIVPKSTEILLNITKKASIFGTLSNENTNKAMTVDDETLDDIDKLLTLLHENAKSSDSLWYYVLVTILVFLGFAASLARYLYNNRRQVFRQNNRELLMRPEKYQTNGHTNGKFFYDTVVYEDVPSAHLAPQPIDFKFKKDYNKMQMSVMPSMRDVDANKIKIKPLPSKMEHVYDIPRPNNTNP